MLEILNSLQASDNRPNFLDKDWDSPVVLCEGFQGSHPDPDNKVHDTGIHSTTSSLSPFDHLFTVPLHSHLISSLQIPKTRRLAQEHHLHIQQNFHNREFQNRLSSYPRLTILFASSLNATHKVHKSRMSADQRVMSELHLHFTWKQTYSMGVVACEKSKQSWFLRQYACIGLVARRDSREPFNVAT